ncbi:MAG TPA: 3-dehydroquinate synthase [Terriglobia bacterium]|nr:3-dehydroquinate synthase [Terriglobia bacterium]
MQRFHVHAASSRYDVIVGRGAWRALRDLRPERYSSIFILSELRPWRRWARLFRTESGLRRAGAILVPEGEGSKSLAQVEAVAARLLALHADRRSLVVLFGGGVIGDLGGFIASTYMRGIDCVQAPTTLLAQVDSSVGGKTAVNVGAMKNLVGTFYPPRLVASDPRVLASLSPRAFRSGLYEVVKHGILAGAPLFEQLESRLLSVQATDVNQLDSIIAAAVKVKVDIVNRDERERSLRHVLNLGHTFAHALEEATAYRRFTHGEAVGWGLLVVTRLAERLGVLKPAAGATDSDAARIVRLVRAVGPLPPIRDLAPAGVARLLPQDKKTVAGRIHWVIPERIGKVRIVTDVELREAAAAFRDVQRDGQRG